MKYRNYTDEDIINKSKIVKSIAGLARELNLTPIGGNYRTIKKNLQRLDINTEHWTGQGWNKAQRLKDWASYKRSNSMKKHLIKERGHKCERCQQTHWECAPITLEIHHVCSSSNELTNIQLLCPNCHALTDNWRRRNSKLN